MRRNASAYGASLRRIPSAHHRDAGLRPSAEAPLGDTQGVARVALLQSLNARATYCLTNYSEKSHSAEANQGENTKSLFVRIIAKSANKLHF